MLDAPGDISLAGEGRLKHFKADKKIIIYSSPGPSHKLTFSILKTKFPEYSSIIWRDGWNVSRNNLSTLKFLFYGETIKKTSLTNILLTLKLSFALFEWNESIYQFFVFTMFLSFQDDSLFNANDFSLQTCTV